MSYFSFVNKNKNKKLVNIFVVILEINEMK